MSYLKFSQDLFLEKAELDRFKRFLTKEGYEFDFLADSEEFGVLQNTYLDPNFDYLQVILGSTANAIKLKEGFAYDKDRLLIHNRQFLKEFVVPTTNDWYWVKASQQYSVKEEGLVSIGGVNATLMTGVATKFKEILRGQENFPIKIKFLNSVNYLDEYEIVEVIDDLNVRVQGTFGTIENNLEFAVVGTFTQGYYPPVQDKNIYQYDDCKIELILETVLNTKPNIVTDKEFLLARVRYNGTTTEIQDYRRDYIHRTRVEKTLGGVTNLDAIIAIESIKKVQTGGKYFYNINFDWKFNVTSETVDLINNIITVNSGSGGTYKTCNDFVNTTFDNWRYYYDDGDYSTIITSTKIGTSISLKLDTVKIGATGVAICPPMEDIEIQYKLRRLDASVYQSENKIYHINTLTPSVNLMQDFIIRNAQAVEFKYKMKNYLKTGAYNDFNENTYYNDQAFDAGGVLVDPSKTTTSKDAILGTALAISSTIVPRFIPMPYDPPLGTDLTLLFDTTGLGIKDEFIGWAICNGNNGTKDWRGVTATGATRIDSSNPLFDLGAPPISADGIANPLDVGAVVGESKHILTQAQLPNYDLPFDQTAHKHDTTGDWVLHSGSDGVGKSLDNGGNDAVDFDTKTTDGLDTVSIDLTIHSGGGGEGHENRQRSRASIWVCRIV